MEDASIINALWRVSSGRVVAADAEQMEIWEIAVYLGHAEELDSGDSPGRPGEREAFHAASRSRLRQRLDHHHGNAPKPEAEPLDPSVLSALSL